MLCHVISRLGVCILTSDDGICDRRRLRLAREIARFSASNWYGSGTMVRVLESELSVNCRDLGRAVRRYFSSTEIRRLFSLWIALLARFMSFYIILFAPWNLERFIASQHPKYVLQSCAHYECYFCEDMIYPQHCHRCDEIAMDKEHKVVFNVVQNCYFLSTSSIFVWQLKCVILDSRPRSLILYSESNHLTLGIGYLSIIVGGLLFARFASVRLRNNVE